MSSWQVIKLVAKRLNWELIESNEIEEKGNHKIELTCMVCGETWMGEEPKMCCNGRECGCMGLPVDPVVCSEECYNKGLTDGYNVNSSKNDK